MYVLFMLLHFSTPLFNTVFGNKETNDLVDLRFFFRTTIQENKVQTLQKYLEEKGLLLNLEDPLLTHNDKLFLKKKIADAKAEHRKLYLKEKRKEYNATQARVELRLNKTGRGNEYDRFRKMAKNKKLATFIKSCAIAYLKNDYVVPDEKIIDGLIKEISRYREERNKEGRNIKSILDKVHRQGMTYQNDLIALYYKMYALDQIDFTFDLEQLVANAMHHPEEHFLEYAKRHLEKTPEAIEQLEKIISKIKTKRNDNQK